MITKLRLVFGAALLLCLGVVAVPTIAGAASPSCDKRVNNTIDKLVECVTIDGVREHQAAFQDIADANDGTELPAHPAMTPPSTTSSRFSKTPATTSNSTASRSPSSPSASWIS